MTGKPDIHERIAAYLDGALSESEARAFEQEVDENPSLAAELERLMDNDALLRAAYAEPSHVERFGRLGRSNGCFAFGSDDFRTALLTLSGGRLLYADSLGLQADGAMLTRDQQLAMLQPQEPSVMQRYNPGAY